MKSTIAAMRPVVMGMILSGAMLLLLPASDEGSSFIDGWSWALFGVALVASLKKFNPIMLIVLSAVAGVAIYYLPTLL